MNGKILIKIQNDQKVGYGSDQNDQKVGYGSDRKVGYKGIDN